MNAKTVGYAMASYFGGRAEVRVRKVDVPVIVVDFTSMYPSVFLLQDIQAIIAAQNTKQRDATAEVRELLESVTLADLYSPGLWLKLRCLVRLKPQSDIVPVRMRQKGSDPYTISVTPFASNFPRWYTLADIVAAKLLGCKTPQIERAIEIVPGQMDERLRETAFLGTRLDPKKQIFKTVIEERYTEQKAKKRDPSGELARRELALKILANSGAYGIFAEINVAVEDPDRVKDASGEPEEPVWYSDVGPRKGPVNDERPGAFFNPIVATLVTGGARLMLAMLEAEVAAAGGTFVFCDTDSLAIVAGTGCQEDVPCISGKTVSRIITGFNRLNPYDIVPNLLKREYEEIENLRCLAISAKRYVLFTRNNRNRLKIIKASESGLGAAIGRTEKETVRKLARRIWTTILLAELGIKYKGNYAKRIAKLIDFDVPLRRRFPISQPRIYDNASFRRLNRGKSYDFRIKPYGFLQTVTPAVEIGDSVQPIAPFERDLTKSRKWAWADLRTGKLIRLDWDGNAHAGTVPVMRLNEFVAQYASHPESKAAGPDGLAATAETRGLLGRLHLTAGEPSRIGKELDRLDEDEGDSLERDQPFVYDDPDDREFEWALGVLGHEPRAEVARELKISVRRFQDILKRRSQPRTTLRQAIVERAKRLRLGNVLAS
jgi:hypothetical protein